jgi:hypothetical protein
MIPPLDIMINPRGMAHIVATQNRGPLTYEFGFEPEFTDGGRDTSSANSRVIGRMDDSLIEGAMTSRQLMDNVRHIYLGKKPYALKQCTRCSAVSLPISSVKKCLNKGWDLRWHYKCPCGGPWKLACLDESGKNHKNNLLSCI